MTLTKNEIVRKFKRKLDLQDVNRRGSRNSLKIEAGFIYDAPSLQSLCKAGKVLPSHGNYKVRAKSYSLDIDETGILDFSPEGWEEILEVIEKGKEMSKKKAQREAKIKEKVDKEQDTGKERNVNKAKILDTDYQRLKAEISGIEQRIGEFDPPTILDDGNIEVTADSFSPYLSLSSGDVFTELTAKVSNPVDADLDNPVIKKAFSPENTEITQCSYDNWSVKNPKGLGQYFTLEVKPGLDVKTNPQILDRFIEEAYFSY